MPVFLFGGLFNMKNKDFSKFSKRNTHKRRSKEKARRELLRALSEVGVNYTGVKLADSTDRGRGGRVSGRVMSDETQVRGVFSSSHSGFGFVRCEGRERDIFIPSGKTLGAIDGDTVELIYHSYTDREGVERTEGRIKKICEYGRRTVIGTLSVERVRNKYIRYCLEPDDAKVNIRPAVRELMGAHRGDKVEGRIIRNGAGTVSVDIIRIFGAAESREANYEAILADSGVTVDFSEAELADARAAAGESISPEGRVDFRSETVFTIDGADAKDLDDAISLRRLPGGKYRLGVHIADVSHYVRERTPLDRAAMSRGTSIYFTDKVVPMLPEALSNGACSLNAGEDKYTLSAQIDLDSEGNILSLSLSEGIIRSAVRGVYSEVNSLLSGEGEPALAKKYKKVMPTLTKMRELYEILKKKSILRGALDFDADEAVILLDADGQPTDIVRRERGVAERMIEQFMLTANEAVATYLSERGIPCVYRVHEEPPEDKFEELVAYAHSLGFDTSVISLGKKSPCDLSRLLSAADERGLSLPVSYTMLRAMSKAKYSDKCSMHFGLGIEHYCHFTSPIRRLSDLATHRIIKRVMFAGKRPESYSSYAARAAAAATEAELRALSAERRIENLYKAIYMSEFVGKSFSATVKSVTPYGLFVELANTVEGLVPIDEMMGTYTFDEPTLTLRSRYKSYRLADRLEVILEEVDIIRGKLRFSISEGY